MNYPFIGSEALANGSCSKSELRTQYRRLFPDVYVNREADRTPVVLARAGWLWSGRAAVVAGRSAAALHGAAWIDADHPVELIHVNRNVPHGIKVHGDRFEADDVMALGEMVVTTPQRTALDLGCWLPTIQAVAAIDDLAAATSLTPADLDGLVERYPGRRGIRRARASLQLVDAGAQSPKETWLRLVLIEAGLPRPTTQIAVRDETGNLVGYLDMGWEDLRVAVEYDGEQHRTDRRQYTWDLRRLERLEGLGWIIVRVVAGDRPPDIVSRVRQALDRRASPQRNSRRPA